MDEGITRLAGRQMESWARELHSSDKWIKSSVHRELLEFLNRSETICTPGYLLRRRIQTAFPQFMARASERSGVPLSDCCDLEGCGNRPWPEALTRGLASVLAESFFPGFGAARTGIDSRQWYSYLTDSGAFGRETAIKLIFALELVEPEGSKLLLAAGRELLSLRNPFDYLCSYCLGHRPRLDYVKALELMRRYESGRSGRYDGPGRGLRQPFGYGMTASLSGRLESLLGGGMDEAGREDELIAYMLAHEEEFTARHGRGGRGAGCTRPAGDQRKISDSASSRVFWLFWNAPRTALVTVLEPGFLMPRMLMHRCSASSTTIAPWGFSCSTSVSAIWEVRRSWTCRRRA